MKASILLLSAVMGTNLYASELECGFESKEAFNQCVSDLSSITRDFGKVRYGCDELGERPPRVASGSSKVSTSHVIHPLNSKFSEGGANCSNFLTDSNPGEYGNAGKEVINYIRQAGESSIYYKNNLAGFGPNGSICPRWNTLSKADKEHFWVWTFASIAHDESKCNPAARNANGTNGVAIGLLQLDDKKSARNWRGPNCKVPSVSGFRENIRCGMDIMGELLRGQAGEYKGSGLIYNRNARNTSYWQKLKSAGGGGIGELIRTHPLCKTN